MEPFTNTSSTIVLGYKYKIFYSHTTPNVFSIPSSILGTHVLNIETSCSLTTISYFFTKVLLRFRPHHHHHLISTCIDCHAFLKLIINQRGYFILILFLKTMCFHHFFHSYFTILISSLGNPSLFLSLCSHTNKIRILILK